MIVDKGCGQGDIRDYCEAGSSRSDIGSFAGVTPALSPWAGRTEADCNRPLVAPSCLLNTRSGGSYCEDSGNEEIVVLIRQSSMAVTEIENDIDYDIGLQLKQELDLPNGLEEFAITINDLALRQALCQNSTHGCAGYVAVFSHGVKWPLESGACAQIACVKT